MGVKIVKSHDRSEMNMNEKNTIQLTNRQKLWLKLFMGLGALAFLVGVFTDPTT